jgi:DNA-binding CsgD family transcriptional regulator
MTSSRTGSISSLEAVAPLLDLLVVPASLFDPTGLWIAGNSLVAAATGYDAGSFVGQRFGFKMPPGIQEAGRAKFRHSVERCEVADFEAAYYDHAERLTAVRLRLLPLREDDSVIGVLALVFEAREESETAALAELPALTGRQRQILSHLAAARSTKDIAEELGLATETVRNHVRALLRELHAHSRLEAVVTADRLGLLPPTPFRGPD